VRLSPRRLWRTPLALAIVFAFMAALGFGSGNILIRVATQRVSPPTATFLAVTTSTLVTLIPALALHSKDMLEQSWSAYAWFALMGAMAYPGARLLNNTAIKMVGASGAAPFVSLQPLFAFALGTAVLGERPDVLVALGTPTIVGGLLLVVTSRDNNSAAQRAITRTSLGYLMATGAAASFAIRDVISRHVVSSLAPPLVTAAYALSMGACMLLSVTLRDVVRSFRQVPASYIVLCGLAGVSQGIALASLFEALSRAPVTVVSPINAANPLVTLALSHLLLRRLESVNLLLAGGTLLSVSGVSMVVLGAAT